MTGNDLSGDSYRPPSPRPIFWIRLSALTWIWLVTSLWILIRAAIGMTRIRPGIGKALLVLWFANTVMYVASVTALISRSDLFVVRCRRCFNIDSASLRDLASLQFSAYTTVFANPST